jgi:peptide/nickel transport system permease protein
MFVIRRLALGVLVLFGVVLITFVVTRMVPSDPAAKWVGPRATVEQKEAARRELGLDQPLYVQFGRYLGDMLRGNLGYSLVSHQAITYELVTLLPATIELVLIASGCAFFLGLPLGILSAAGKDGWLDHVCRFFSVGAVSLPAFAVGLFLQLVFYRWLDLLPIGGRLTMENQLFADIPQITHFLLIDTLITGKLELFKDALLHTIMPAIALAAYPTGLVARMTRSALLEILNEDYIKAARSYGLGPRTVLWSYATKNSLGPTATVMTLMIGYALVNTFLIEAIFGWPGIGSYIGNAVISLNYPAILGVTIFSACSYVVLNLIADLIVALDPRARK